MRRVMLLALLALALPMAVSATTVTFSIPPGNFAVGSISGTAFNSGWNGSMQTLPGPGSLRIALTLLGLSPSPCTVAVGTCPFTGGSVTVVSPVGSGIHVFTNSLTDGTLTRTSDTAAISASLVPGPGVPGGFVKMNFTFSGTTMLSGSATVTVVPEPSSLELLGTGLIGLVGIMKRKLKLGT